MVGMVTRHPRSKEVDEGNRLLLLLLLGTSHRGELTPILLDGAHGHQVVPTPVVHHGEKLSLRAELDPINPKIGATKIGLIGGDGTTSRKKSGGGRTGIPKRTPITQIIIGRIATPNAR